MRLPLLRDVGIASPCSESWDGMEGDDRKRYCGKCEKNVYNLSAMTERDARQFVADHEGGGVCIRLYRRIDGTVINADCPVGIRRKRVTRIAAAAVAFGGAGLAIANAAPAEPEPHEIPAHVHKQRKRSAKVADDHGGDMQTLTVGLAKAYNKVVGDEATIAAGATPTATATAKVTPPAGTTPAVPHHAVMGFMVPPTHSP